MAKEIQLRLEGREMLLQVCELKLKLAILILFQSQVDSELIDLSSRIRELSITVF